MCASGSHYKVSCTLYMSADMSGHNRLNSQRGTNYRGMLKYILDLTAFAVVCGNSNSYY